MKKFIAVLTAAAAAAAVSATAGAYSINKDLGFGWSASVTIDGSEFADVTTETTVTITYEVNQSLAEMEGQDYWCIKPMINDAGWPFINTLVGATLSEGGDSYVIEPDSTSISFTIPAEELEHLQIAGMAIMGHGIELLEMTFTDAPAAEPAPETPAEPETPSEPETPAGTDATAPEATEPSKGNPDTGVEGVAAAAGIAVLAAGALMISRRRK